MELWSELSKATAGGDFSYTPGLAAVANADGADGDEVIIDDY